MNRRWLFFLLLLFFALTGLLVFLLRVYRSPGAAFATPSPTAAPPRSTSTPLPTLSPEERLSGLADKSFMSGRVNVLFIGFDQSPERNDVNSPVYRGDENGFRSDVLMLLAVDFEQNTAHLISIPRDTYTPIYKTKGRWKINAAFAKGGGAENDGFLYAVKTVEMLFGGIPVDYYAGVDMEGLKAVVDAIGGVDYDVDVKIKLNGRVLEEGYQHLDGQQVLDYCRARKGISTDVGRNDRQQRMLLAIFTQMQQQNKLTTIPAIYSAAKDYIHTNLSVPQIAALASFALKLPADEIRRTTLQGQYVANVYRASYYVLENKKLIALVKNEFGVTIKRDKKYDLATVKRDKAAAEAAARATALPEIESMLTLPADTTAAFDRDPLEYARASAARLLEVIEQGGSLDAVRRAERDYLAAVRRLYLLYSPECGGNELFSMLNLE